MRYLTFREVAMKQMVVKFNKDSFRNETIKLYNSFSFKEIYIFDDNIKSDLALVYIYILISYMRCH